MARIDDLLTHVADAKLRRQLATAIGEIRDTRQFGITFESHIPETVALSGMPAKPGSLIIDRKNTAGEPLVVVRAKGESKIIAKNIKTGEEYEINASDVLVQKPFGDAIYPYLKPVGKSPALTIGLGIR